VPGLKSERYSGRIVKFNINNFKINDVSSWLLEFRVKSKITFLTTSVRSPKSPEIIFKV